MGIFGWSYPPGCSGPPDDDERPCDLCGLSVDSCICPECPTCEAHGDPKCYEQHGLMRSAAQIASRERMEAAWKAEADAERDRFELLFGPKGMDFKIPESWLEPEPLWDGDDGAESVMRAPDFT